MAERSTKWLCAVCLVLIAAALCQVASAAKISGELKTWHRVTLTFDGPETSETADPNPFLYYRLNVTFTHKTSGKAHLVPGFFAGDGNAANTGADTGNRWRVHFAPDETGRWNYIASFRSGTSLRNTP